MRKTILVPTDFSANSLSAARYACQLASKRNFNVHLFHCYTSGTVSFDQEQPSESTDNNDLVLKADILMQDLVHQLKAQFPAVEVSANCIRGLIDEKLPAEAKNEHYIVIIMGAKGSSAKKSIYWGSTTVAITAKSPVPVIAIPEGHDNFDPKHINLLTKFKSEELETLKEYLNIVGDVEQLTLTHVYRETADKDEVMDRLSSWEFNIREMDIVQNVFVASDHISKTDVDLDTVPEVVNKLIDESNSDMVLITKTRKSFFGRLFTPSVSKALTLELKKPAFFDKIEDA